MGCKADKVRALLAWEAELQPLLPWQAERPKQRSAAGTQAASSGAEMVARAADISAFVRSSHDPVQPAVSPMSPSSRGSRTQGVGFAPASQVDEGAFDAGEASLRLQSVAQEVAGCTACALHATRTQTVFGRGSANARLVFVGEGPGFHEDQQGLPFVGPAGKLLDKMVAAMKLRADDVYICNVVKCRPPDNRTPLAPEVQACSGFLQAQIGCLRPRCIVALGRCAAVALGVAEERGSWRGVWGQWRGIATMPTFHPAYLLRSPDKKREVWHDLQQVMERLAQEEAESVAGALR